MLQLLQKNQSGKLISSLWRTLLYSVKWPIIVAGRKLWIRITLSKVPRGVLASSKVCFNWLSASSSATIDIHAAFFN